MGGIEQQLSNMNDGDGNDQYSSDTSSSGGSLVGAVPGAALKFVGSTIKDGAQTAGMALGAMVGGPEGAQVGGAIGGAVGGSVGGPMEEAGNSLMGETSTPRAAPQRGGSAADVLGSFGGSGMSSKLSGGQFGEALSGIGGGGAAAGGETAALTKILPAVL